MIKAIITAFANIPSIPREYKMQSTAINISILSIDYLFRILSARNRHPINNRKTSINNVRYGNAKSSTILIKARKIKRPSKKVFIVQIYIQDES